jgi:protein-tyrosine-phosphatase
MSLTSLEQLEVKGADLKAAFASIGDMRPGSLSETYGKCGSQPVTVPTLCQAKIARTRSGSAFDRTVDSKTVARGIPSGPAVEQSKQQVADYKRFRELSRELIEISDRICDLRLKDLEGAREVETKKTPSPQVCKMRSHERSKNCSIPEPWRRSTSRLWKTAMRRRPCSWPPAYSSSDSTAAIPITRAARCPVPVAAGRVMSNDDGKVS